MGGIINESMTAPSWCEMELPIGGYRQGDAIRTFNLRMSRPSNSGSFSSAQRFFFAAGLSYAGWGMVVLTGLYGIGYRPAGTDLMRTRLGAAH